MINRMDVVVLGVMLSYLCGVAMGQNYVVINAVGTNLMSCYECNVWKAGYGQLCDNPRIRTGCYACMKVETIIFMGYYKNTPRYSTVISRACANSKSVPFYNECQYFQMGDGHSRRCYCNTPLCNKGTPTAAANSLGILVVCAFLSSMANSVIRHLY